MTTTEPDAVERMLPLYEAKMIHHFDHRWATYESFQDARLTSIEEKLNPCFDPAPRYWVREELVAQRTPNEIRSKGANLFGWRNVARNTDERTTICSVFPTAGVGHSMPLLFAPGSRLLVAVMSSFAWDFIARQKVAGVNFTYNLMMQMAMPSPDRFDAFPLWGAAPLRDFVLIREAELTRTSWSISHDEAPFSWDPERRVLLRAELDAALFHLYGIERDDVDYIMETFPIVKRKDEAAHGEYRTKRLILEVFDAMQRAIDTGVAYETILDPPPGEGARHPARDVVGTAAVGSDAIDSDAIGIKGARDE